MSTPPSRAPRGNDTYTELILAAKGPYLALALKLREKSLFNHLNRTVINFEFPDGTIETYTVWPGDGDPEKHRLACDQLNWSEH